MLENRKKSMSMIVEGLKASRNKEIFDYEAFFESMKGEPQMDDWETTNEEWLSESVDINEAKMVTPQGKMYPKNNIGVVLAGGAGLN